MKHSILKGFAILAMLCLLIGALASCSFSGNPTASPIIGENGNWWIGETDTGVSATGVNIVSVECSADGKNLVFNYSNGTSTEVSMPSPSCACDVCENTMTYETYDNKHTAAKNEYGEWEFTEGLYITICNDCGHSEMFWDVMHKWSEEEVIPPTCSNKGYTVRSCEICGYREVLEGSELPYSSHILNIDGVKIPITDWYKKNIDGKDYYYFVYDMTTDSMFDLLDLPDIKCNENNILQGFFVCAHCDGNIFVNLYTEHHYEAYEITKQPTDTTPGEMTAICKKCDHQDVLPIPPLQN